MKTSCIILATDLEVQMRSAIPTALHLLLGKPLFQYAMDAVKDMCEEKPVIIIGDDNEEIQKIVGDQVTIAVQEHPSGMGEAILQAKGKLPGESDMVLVTSANQPLLSNDTLSYLVKEQSSNDGPITILTYYGENPGGMGCVARGEEGGISNIVVEMQASPQELDAGVYCFSAAWLWENLPQISLSSEEEDILAELIRKAVAEGHNFKAVQLENPQEALRIHNRVNLAEAEAALREQVNHEWMMAGVTFIDPDRTYIDRDVKIGPDTIIFPDTYLYGECRIGEGCRLGPNSVIHRSIIGNRCTVLSSVIEDAVIEDDVDIGPFSHMRKGAHLAQGVHIGNFGEVKNSYLGPDTKMGHFSYIGDGTIGTNVNIGAGTITCNFDGEKKNPTIIEDDVFVGSDTMLVAPVKLEKGSRTGAGSVVTKDVPEKTIVAGVPARAVRKLEEND